MSGFTARIGFKRPVFFRKSDGAVTNTRAAEICADRMAGCSRPDREGDTEPLAYYEGLRCPAPARRPSVESITPEAPLLSENLEDWIFPEELRKKVALYQDNLAGIRLIQEELSPHFAWNRWVFNPPGMKIPVRLTSSLLRRSRESHRRNKEFPSNQLPPIIFLGDALVLSSKDLLRTTNFGKKTLSDLRNMLCEIIDRIERGDYSLLKISP